MVYTKEQLLEMSDYEKDKALAIIIYGKDSVIDNGKSLTVNMPDVDNGFIFGGWQRVDGWSLFIEDRRQDVEYFEAAFGLIHQFKLYIKPPLKDGGKWKVGSIASDKFAINNKLNVAIGDAVLMMDI